MVRKHSYATRPGCPGYPYGSRRVPLQRHSLQKVYGYGRGARITPRSSSGPTRRVSHGTIRVSPIRCASCSAPRTPHGGRASRVTCSARPRRSPYGARTWIQLRAIQESPVKDPGGSTSLPGAGPMSQMPT